MDEAAVGTRRTSGDEARTIQSPSEPSLWREFLRGFLRVLRANPLTFIGFILVLIISVVALLVVLVPLVSSVILGHTVLVTPYDPNALSTDYGQPPSASHLLGTDNLGQDVFSRIVAALPLDLAIGFGITGFALLVGGGLGLVAGYWDEPRTLGGAVSVIILRITDVFLAFPSLVLALAIAASLGRGTGPSMLAILLTWWPYYVRLARGEVLAVKHQPYVMAARAGGVSEVRILFRHVLRNLAEPLLVYYTLDVGTVIVTFSTISFIGIGVPLGVPEWGSMVESYERFLLTLPWTVLSAGAAIFVTVLAFSLFGDGLRDILDPRSRRALVQAAVPSTLAAKVAAAAEA
ncbi:MAG: ABC transporter permease [Methanobacteriota archaeon]|nr:MAG: ABC transporter permease [Euryarchaeota archaeon]